MSKFTFRTKALDINKPMQVFRGTDDPEILSETAAMNRTVPIMPTGMEKEEEEVRAEEEGGGGGGEAASLSVPRAMVVLFPFSLIIISLVSRSAGGAHQGGH